jgi:hypothetical protein
MSVEPQMRMEMWPSFSQVAGDARQVDLQHFGTEAYKKVGVCTLRVMRALQGHCYTAVMLLVD